MKTEFILSSLEAKHHGEKEYLQAVKEVLISIEDISRQSNRRGTLMLRAMTIAKRSRQLLWVRARCSNPMWPQSHLHFAAHQMSRDLSYSISYSSSGIYLLLDLKACDSMMK